MVSEGATEESSAFPSTEEKVPVAVFASGQGTNARALWRAQDRCRFRVVTLVSDRPEAPVVAWARAVGLPIWARSPKAFPDKGAYEAAVLSHLRAHDVRWIALAGYMRLVGPTLLEAYPNRIVNVHPSLLPAFPGKDAVRQALDYGVRVTGVTIHLVDAGIDTGPIVAQAALRIRPGEAAETLLERLHRLEHRLYPRTLDRLVAEPHRVVGRTVVWLTETREGRPAWGGG
ncbi:phosphoribosylglycinamide formyltransferase [Hydrogenibacillus schlegelii]|uniref:phosphoribosylglycinamide formyltransferase n=1 Tax=Hydrogenibacillus schlegelii TaxID=1484 RepID=UPI0009E8CC2D|nr:phosphoribosylglycinamide formyltransferase [Hydrogenibacillus schlegelii]